MLLGLDTTTERLHLALVGPRGRRLRWLRAPAGQSQVLLPEVDALLAQAGATARDLAGVACCVGPGGFTSLRIGVATAEGLALTGLPTWGFSAFELRFRAVALEGGRQRSWILLDGQRGEAFLQPWEGKALAPAEKLPLAALGTHLKGERWWAPAPFREKVSPFLSQPALVLQDEDQATLEALGRITFELSKRPPEALLVPFYLRETDAEVNFPEASGHLPETLRRGGAR